MIWSRIDQKTCLKAIASANLIPVVIEPVLCGDELQTDLPALEAKLEELGPENVTCIVTTTSCFAPRACDDVRSPPAPLSGLCACVVPATGAVSLHCLPTLKQSLYCITAQASSSPDLGSSTATALGASARAVWEAAVWPASCCMHLTTACLHASSSQPKCSSASPDESRCTLGHCSHSRLLSMRDHRLPLQVEGVARLCAAQDLPHIINNAYGVQSAQICARVTRACRVGRVDAIIQSTDKNFMVPVGGAILTAPLQRPQLVEAVSSGYPGRASASAHVDLGITLLHWGRSGWLKVLGERESLFAYLQVCCARASPGSWCRLACERSPVTSGGATSMVKSAQTVDTGRPSLHAGPRAMRQN